MIYDMDLHISCSFSFLCRIYLFQSYYAEGTQALEPSWKCGCAMIVLLITAGACECRAAGHPHPVQMGFNLELLKLRPGAAVADKNINLVPNLLLESVDVWPVESGGFFTPQKRY